MLGERLESRREVQPGKRGVGKQRPDPMFVTAAVFHLEISPLKMEAGSPDEVYICPWNMNLRGMGRQGWAGRCLDAKPPRAAEREAPAKGGRESQQCK